MDEIRIKLVREPRLEYNAVTSPEKAVKMVQDLIGDLDRENFVSVNLDNSGKPINYNIVSIGTETSAQISIAGIIKGTLLSGSTALLIFHNHPSGNISPSKDDIETTNKIQSACALMGINLLDHIIVTESNYFSFKNNGLLNDVSNLKVNDILFSSVSENKVNYDNDLKESENNNMNNNELISYKDYLKDWNYGPYADNSKLLKEAREKFNHDIRNCDVVLVESSKSFDPEGISSDWIEDNITYGGDLESVRAKLNEILEKAKNDKYQSVTKFNDDSYQIYYENAISKVTYTLMDNPLKQRYTYDDMCRVEKNAEAKGYKMLEFNYCNGQSIIEKNDIYIKNDINGNEIPFTDDELHQNNQSAWQRANELANMGYDNEKALAKAMFFDNLIENKNERFSILKEYPNINYVLARNNNLNAPEPYVAAYRYNYDSKSWEQGHYFVERDDAIEYLNNKEKEWLNNVDDDVLLDIIKSKLYESDINKLTNSIYSNKNNGKEM